MMNAELLSELLQATLAVSLAIAVVLATRRPMRRWLGARGVYGLWLIVPLAMAAVLVPAPKEPVRMVTAATTMIGLPQAVTAAPAPDRFAPSAWLWLWFTGGVVTMGVFARRQAAFDRRVRRRPDQPFDEVIGHGPAVSGLFRPRIVLPADFGVRYSADEQVLVLAHEQAHLRRGDVQAQACAVVLRCVFWFNPLVHAAASRFRFDQELACDASVIANFPDARRRYAGAMLKTQLADFGVPIGCTWPSSQPLKERIAMLTSPIPSARRRWLIQSSVLSCCLAGAVAVWAAQSPSAPTGIVQQTGFDSQISIKLDGVEAGSPRLVSRPGESVAWSVGEGSQRWDVTLALRSVDAQQIDITGEIRRGGTLISRPRILAQDGTKAAIAVSTPDGKSLLEFDIIATKSNGAVPSPINARAASTMPFVTKITAADQLSRPAIPPGAEGIDGKVVLNVLVGADGAVKEVKVERATPAGLFDAEAIKAAYQWKFSPASRSSDGKKVEGWVRVPVHFTADAKDVAAPPKS